jgi:hypothetical protein
LLLTEPRAGFEQLEPLKPGPSLIAPAVELGAAAVHSALHGFNASSIYNSTASSVFTPVQLGAALMFARGIALLLQDRGLVLRSQRKKGIESQSAEFVDHAVRAFVRISAADPLQLLKAFRGVIPADTLGSLWRIEGGEVVDLATKVRQPRALAKAISVEELREKATQIQGAAQGSAEAISALIGAPVSVGALEGPLAST